MAIEWESSCCGCPGLPCIGSACKHYYKFPVLRCDRCNHGADYLWEVDGEQLCEDCVLDMFVKIDPDELQEEERYGS